MDTFVISEKMMKAKLREEGAAQFQQDLTAGLFDRMLFTYQRERAFDKGIVVVRKKHGEEIPLFYFDCKPWEFEPPDGGKTVTRTDGITFAMLADDKQVHTFTMATYEDYVWDNKTTTKGDIVRLRNSDSPIRIMLCFSHADEDISQLKTPLIVSGAFALSVFCDIQLEALRMPEKIEKSRGMTEEHSAKEYKKKEYNRPPIRSVSLTNHIVYRYEPSDANVRKEFVRWCECWTVRGYYRHNKSGTISFVKPYKKGKNRNAESNTVYMLDR